MASREPKLKYEGHTDFVKSVASARLNGQDVLISGGTDAQMLVFDIATGKRISVLKGHVKGIQDLQVDPVSLDADGQELIVFSAGSDREIRQFDISTGSKDLTGTDALLAHDTNVYKLFFDRDGDLWTASADKTTKCLVREDGWKANLTLTHPDFVRDVVVYEQGGWIVTACRDEEVRVWNRSVSDQLPPNFQSYRMVLLTIPGIRPETFTTPFRAISRKSLGLRLWGRRWSASVSMPPFDSGL